MAKGVKRLNQHKKKEHRAKYKICIQNLSSNSIYTDDFTPSYACTVWRQEAILHSRLLFFSACNKDGSPPTFCPNVDIMADPSFPCAAAWKVARVRQALFSKLLIALAKPWWPFKDSSRSPLRDSRAPVKHPASYSFVSFAQLSLNRCNDVIFALVSLPAN